MTNQKGLGSSFTIIIGLFIVLAVGIGSYYLGTLKNPIPTPTAQSSPAPKTKQIDLNVYDQNAELNGFPVYTSALFVDKKYSPPCQGDVSGFSNCDVVTYTFETRDDYDQVNSWYKLDTSHSGWVCKGGAGSYDNTRAASGRTGCTKGNKNYNLDLSANQVKTSISINIPMSDYNGKFFTP